MSRVIKIKQKDFTPGGRRFRKTAEELAHAYQAQLETLGLTVTKEEIITIIRSCEVSDVVSTFVGKWVNEEKKRGVKIV